MVQPFGQIRIPGLGNRFLFYAHDDGWYLKLYYVHWSDIESLIQAIVEGHHVSMDHTALSKEVRVGQSGFWFTRSNIVRLEKTHDIDALLNSSKYPTQ
jgi:hypothetical protein